MPSSSSPKRKRTRGVRSAASASRRKTKAADTPARAPAGGERMPTIDPATFKPDLASMKEGDPGTATGRPLRLYADGIFDLLHLGHTNALKQAKQLFPNTVLIVGCCSDAVTHRYKGLTVCSEAERYASLRHCRWVDDVVEDSPWVLTDDFLEKHRIDYVCHDALPYADASGDSSDGDVYAALKRAGRFCATERTEGVSTSDIITRIICNYDDFVLRQMKRGISGRQLGVPFLKRQKLKMTLVRQEITKRIAKGFGECYGWLRSQEGSFVEQYNRIVVGSKRKTEGAVACPAPVRER